MKHEKDHEKRVVLEDIPSDDTMISSLALCEREQMAVSSYLALNMRNKHGQFVMNIGVTSIWINLTWMMMITLKIPVMMMTPHRIIQMVILTQWNWMMTQMRYSLTTSWLQLLQLGKPEELTLNIFPRFGESVMKMPKGPLMSLPKHPLEQMIQPYQGTTQPMIGCSGTKGSRTFSS